MTETAIFQRALAGQPIDVTREDYQEIPQTVQRTQELLKTF